MTGEVIRSSKATAVRYERDRPGELVHMDVKKLGKIPDGGGWRAHGRAATVDHRHKKIQVARHKKKSLQPDKAFEVKLVKNGRPASDQNNIIQKPSLVETPEDLRK